MDAKISTKRKMNIVQNVMRIENNKALHQLELFVQKLLEGDKTDSRKKTDIITGNEKLIHEVEFDASKLSFDEWNNQFNDNRSLDEFLPEYGMTLGEFRRKIYEAESGEEISKVDFFKSMEQW